jgi:hypothetical protein
MKHLLLTLSILTLAASFAAGQASPDQDATALEEQYKTCAKHYIPSEKCTPEIYRQLKNKDSAPLDPQTSSALSAVKAYQKKLKNPASMQVHTAYVTDSGDVCLEIGGQNTLGGQTVDRVVFTNNGKWRDGTGLLGSLASPDHVDGSRNMWPGYCTRGFHQKLVPGTDVTDKVNQALKDAKGN